MAKRYWALAQIIPWDDIKNRLDAAEVGDMGGSAGFMPVWTDRAKALEVAGGREDLVFELKEARPGQRRAEPTPDPLPIRRRSGVN